MTARTKIKKGDKITVISGKDKGRTGVVKKVILNEGKVIIEKINLVKKHVKPMGKGKPGGIIEMEKPLQASKVMVICPQCGKKTKIGYQLDKNGNKYRICRKCQSLVDQPNITGSKNKKVKGVKR